MMKFIFVTFLFGLSLFRAVAQQERQTCGGQAWPVGCEVMDYDFVCLTSECEHSECCPTCTGFDCPAPTEAYDYHCSDNPDGGVCDEDYCCGSLGDCHFFFDLGGSCPSGFVEDFSRNCAIGRSCVEECCRGTCGDQFPDGSCEPTGLGTCAGFGCTGIECCAGTGEFLGGF